MNHTTFVSVCPPSVDWGGALTPSPRHKHMNSLCIHFNYLKIVTVNVFMLVIACNLMCMYLVVSMVVLLAVNSLFSTWCTLAMTQFAIHSNTHHNAYLFWLLLITCISFYAAMVSTQRIHWCQALHISCSMISKPVRDATLSFKLVFLPILFTQLRYLASPGYKYTVTELIFAFKNS